MTQSAPGNVREEMAPGGVLRVGVNLGNPLIAQKDPGGGAPRGVGPSLARELARRLDARIEYVTYDGAGAMADAVKSGAWDVAFLATDPKRASEIAFSAPYVQIEASYLVKADSRLRRFEDVDRPGIRVASGKGAAYDLWLERNLKHAERVLAATSAAAIEMFASRGDIDAVAGVRNPLVSASAKLPGTRVIDGSFMAIGQAAGVPRARQAAARYLAEFIEEVKASGFVQEALAQSGVTEATLAPPAQ
jgi:polar amino acid transport system substrate-binding protein